MLYEMTKAKLVQKRPSELHTTDDPRAFTRHLEEIGNSYSKIQVEAPIIDENDIVAVGNTRVLGLIYIGDDTPITCMQIPMDEEGRKAAAFISNNMRYAPSVATDAVYLHNIIQTKIDSGEYTKVGGRKEFAESLGLSDNYIKGILAHFRPQTVIATEEDKKLEEGEKVNASAGLELIGIAEKTAIPMDTLERVSNEKKLTSKQLRYINNNSEILTPCNGEISKVEQLMAEVKKEITSVTIVIPVAYKETIMDMTARATRDYTQEKLSGL
jgi:hypothetical protein